MLRTHCAISRWLARLAALAPTIVVLGLALSACSGTASFTTRSDSPTPEEARAAEAQRETNGHHTSEPSPATRQASLPSDSFEPDMAWDEGDAAFQSGDHSTAQRQFGLVYLVDPSYRNGQIRAALMETCRQLGNDCGLVMGRLDLLRLEYTNQVGPREQWVPQQEADYTAILSCYDEGLAGHYDTAYYAGHGALAAPLPAFATLARQCVDRVEAMRTQQMAYAMHEEAVATWDDAYDAMSRAYGTFDAALDADDWDAIVEAYPAYKVAEEPVAEIVASGALDQDAQRADEVEQAARWLDQVAAWEVANTAEYESMRDAIRHLDDHAEYNQALIEYEAVQVRLTPLEDELRSLTLAAEATSGDERASIQRRIDAKEAEIREVRRELRRIMGVVNNLRAEVGLPAREAPYGLD